ncbi:MAG: ATP-binding cassette domain-containing protein, partial [Coriobacteriia bacterium]|nr:ATP-binding cassette domain-containing protein [Coriobacteriia bacterium]
MAEPLIKVENLSKDFAVSGGLIGSRLGAKVSAVKDVSFTIDSGSTLGLVGESGSGKSTIGRCIIRLLNPTAGTITVNGRNVHALRGKELKDFRRDVQIVFQDPQASLNPRMTIGELVREPFVIHKIGDKDEQIQKVKDL